jgi:mannonate dehydratase
MKLGLNLPAHLLTPENFQFARQAGAEAIIAHLVDYEALTPHGRRFDWRAAAAPRSLWTVAALTALRRSVEDSGLELAAIENIDPAFWHDILLDGPRKAEQLEDMKELVRRIGAAGIPCLGYLFSLAGVWGQVWDAPVARGGAATAAFDAEALHERPIPSGEVWGLAYPYAGPQGDSAPVESATIWRRLEEFLAAIVPVAEQSGVRLAAHPDDPPLPRLRGAARLLHHPDDLQRLLDVVSSPSNALDFCQGTVTEMVGEGVYEAIDRFARQGRVAYVHLRNVRGRVPRYLETFIDDGDIDIVRALHAYQDAGFDGVLVPDHAPSMSCAAPWHAGMAFALGYLRCGLQQLESTRRPDSRGTPGTVALESPRAIPRHDGDGGGR